MAHPRLTPGSPPGESYQEMTHENVRSVIESNRPFVISLADGKEYRIPHRDFISFTRKGTSVVVSTEDDRVHILPLITMTGIAQDHSTTEA